MGLKSAFGDLAQKYQKNDVFPKKEHFLSQNRTFLANF
jgi:hypothetical protein